MFVLNQNSQGGEVWWFPTLLSRLRMFPIFSSRVIFRYYLNCADKSLKTYYNNEKVLDTTKLPCIKKNKKEERNW